MGILLARLSAQYGAWTAIRNLATSVAAVLLLATPVTAGQITVAALGDSLTQGYGLPDGDGFVPQLQAWLDAHGGGILMINAGVSGDTTAGGLARIDWTLAGDVDALIVALGGNDLLRGLEPAESRANLDAILAKAAARNLPVLLVASSAPGNYGADYKAEFDAIYPDLAAKYGTRLAPGFLDILLDGRDAAAVLRDYLQNDGLHPNKDGVALIVERLGPEVQALAGDAAE
jgi:acyl-CoA thioesterase-1